MPDLAASDVHLWLRYGDGAPASRDWLRQILSRYHDTDPQHWRFETIGAGKPRLCAGQAPMDFNLSHSGEWLACAVTAGAPVGLDIEYARPGRDLMRLARRFFHPAEVKVLQDLDETPRLELFYSLWTLKEATVKSRAAAVAPLLESLRFDLQGNAIVPGFDDHPAAYRLLRLQPDCHLALCLPAPAAFGELRVFSDQGSHWTALEPPAVAASCEYYDRS